MREISYLERLAEELIEGGFARVLKPKLQPVQIAKALAKEMGKTQMVGPDGPLVANRYSVSLNPADFALFAGFQANLERELAAYLRGYADRKGYKPMGAVSVYLQESPDVLPGRFDLEGVMADSPALSAPSGPNPPIGSTMEMPLVSVQRREASSRASHHQPSAALVGPSGEQLEITRATTAVGRAVDNDVVLDARSVSRHHAQIRWESGRYVLEDLDSTNGTFASGQRVRQHTLVDGEELSFGGITFRFRVAGR